MGRKKVQGESSLFIEETITGRGTRKVERSVTFPSAFNCTPQVEVAFSMVDVLLQVCGAF